ncbi:MAG: tetratricopeptide repeat protein [Pirellulaceae bacterium]
MFPLEELRGQQLLQEAEGYLELIFVLADRFELEIAIRDRLAQRSLHCLDQLPELMKRGEQYHQIWGQALQVMEQYQQAVGPLQQAAMLAPDQIDVWLSLAWCQKRCGRLDLAIQALEEALLVDSEEAIVHFNLACYWSLAEHSRQALTHLAEAFELDLKYRDLVDEEEDFDPIRSHPDFLALTGMIV